MVRHLHRTSGLTAAPSQMRIATAGAVLGIPCSPLCRPCIDACNDAATCLKLPDARKQGRPGRGEIPPDGQSPPRRKTGRRSGHPLSSADRERRTPVMPDGRMKGRKSSFRHKKSGDTCASPPAPQSVLLKFFGQLQHFLIGEHGAVQAHVMGPHLAMATLAHTTAHMGLQ